MGYKSPLKLAIPVYGQSTTPLDSTTYYFGEPVSSVGTGATSRPIVMPRQGIITSMVLLVYSATVAGTAEDWTMIIRKNDTTDYTFATVAANTTARYFTNYALNIPVNALDYITVKTTTPAWVTNPEGVRITGFLILECE